MAIGINDNAASEWNMREPRAQYSCTLSSAPRSTYLPLSSRSPRAVSLLVGALAGRWQTGEEEDEYMTWLRQEHKRRSHRAPTKTKRMLSHASWPRGFRPHSYLGGSGCCTSLGLTLYDGNLQPFFDWTRYESHFGPPYLRGWTTPQRLFSALPINMFSIGGAPPGTMVPIPIHPSTERLSTSKHWRRRPLL